MQINLPASLFRTRMNLHLRKNLDGTFSVSATPNNTRRRGKETTVKCRAFNLQMALDDIGQRLDEKIEACEIIL